MAVAQLGTLGAYMLRPHAALLMLCLVGCTQRNHSLNLVRWLDGTNHAYGIEVAYGDGHAVVIPDVLSIQTTERFVIGKAEWKYIEGFWKSSTGAPITNSFWFALDKEAVYPKCYASVTTNEQMWSTWCTAHHVSTELLRVGEFVRSAQTNLWQGADHHL